MKQPLHVHGRWKTESESDMEFDQETATGIPNTWQTNVNPSKTTKKTWETDYQVIQRKFRKKRVSENA